MPETTGTPRDRLRRIHYTRITRGPREVFLTWCTNEGLLGVHGSHEDAVTDAQWHREETR